MEDRPTTIRVYPGELRPVYYTSVLASQTTTTLEVYIHITGSCTNMYNISTRMYCQANVLSISVWQKSAGGGGGGGELQQVI